MVLPHFDVFCDLLLNRCMVTRNLFVLAGELIEQYFRILRITVKVFAFFGIQHHDIKLNNHSVTRQEE